ncbi:4-hydroxy-tetrahydrodipicolinate synthase [Elysia marginata]|uniref:4-hydroxy-2-oxoglutarate aldolase, mitochondrial n=1 Tax=Elysia marginata TaxID=1093978 RepID=A0AAV4GWI4_9GAST|nr:4-hydroxy-tetrahydrodipicolinate synthase [Elysia marginata]
MNSLLGTGVAIVTPFKANLEIDVEALRKVIDYCIGGGVEYLVSLGTTSEKPTLSKEEQELINQTVTKHNGGRVPLVIGIGGNNTKAVIEKLNTVDISGFSAILSVTPSYNRPTQKGLYKHFEQVALSSPLPIILYNVPSRTGCSLLPETVLELASKFDNIVAIKEATGKIEIGMKILRDKPKDFMLISGDDTMSLPLTLSGGSGAISVIANGLPRAFSDMIRLALERKVDSAYSIQYKLLELMSQIFEEGNPAGVKALLEIMGICSSKVRLPLAEASDHLKIKIKKELCSIKS